MPRTVGRGCLFVNRACSAAAAGTARAVVSAHDDEFDWVGGERGFGSRFCMFD